MRDAVQAMLEEEFGLPPVALHPLEQGTGRPVLRVDSAGEPFVLKCYTADEEGLAAWARSAAGHARAATYGLPTAGDNPQRLHCDYAGRHAVCALPPR